MTGPTDPPPPRPLPAPGPPPHPTTTGPGPRAATPGPPGRDAVVTSGAGAGLPTLNSLIWAAQQLGEAMIDTLGRNYDPVTAPSRDPWDPSDTDIRLGRAVVHVRAALRELRLVPTAPVPLDHPERKPGEEAWAPGLAAVPGRAACESPDGAGGAVGAGASSDPRPGRVDIAGRVGTDVRPRVGP